MVIHVKHKTSIAVNHIRQFTIIHGLIHGNSRGCNAVSVQRSSALLFHFFLNSNRNAEEQQKNNRCQEQLFLVEMSS